MSWLESLDFRHKVDRKNLLKSFPTETVNQVYELNKLGEDYWQWLNSNLKVTHDNSTLGPQVNQVHINDDKQFTSKFMEIGGLAHFFLSLVGRSSISALI